MHQTPTSLSPAGDQTTDPFTAQDAPFRSEPHESERWDEVSDPSISIYSTELRSTPIVTVVQALGLAALGFVAGAILTWHAVRQLKEEMRP